MNAKTIGAIALAAAAFVLVAGAAQAVALKGRGELSAAGNGFAVLDFRGGATVAGAGLAVVDPRAVVDTRGEGRVTPLPDGRALFEGFGLITVRSFDERTRIEVAGARLRLRARGAGVAVLKGVGHFMTDEHDGTWADDLVLHLEPDDD